MGRCLGKHHAAAAAAAVIVADIGPAEGAWIVVAGDSVVAGLVVLVLVLVLVVASDIRYAAAGGVGNHAVLVWRSVEILPWLGDLMRSYSEQALWLSRVGYLTFDAGTQ